MRIIVYNIERKNDIINIIYIFIRRRRNVWLTKNDKRRRIEGRTEKEKEE